MPVPVSWDVEHCAPTLDLVRLADTVAALREQTDLVVQVSSGGPVTDTEADRLAVLDSDPDAASCSMDVQRVLGDRLRRQVWGVLDRTGHDRPMTLDGV